MYYAQGSYFLNSHKTQKMKKLIIISAIFLSAACQEQTLYTPVLFDNGQIKSVQVKRYQIPHLSDTVVVKFMYSPKMTHEPRIYGNYVNKIPELTTRCTADSTYCVHTSYQRGVLLNKK